MKKLKADIVIAGGGLAGLTLACLLANQGLETICIDRDDPHKQAADTFDGRTTAISYGSSQILTRTGVWQQVKPHGCPIKHIDILDGASDILLDFKAEDQPFGWIVENHFLRRALFTRAEASKGLTWLTNEEVKDINLEKDAATIKTNAHHIEGALLVGADGRQSFVRQAAGIRSRFKDYKQRAIVCVVEHEKPHNNIAVEHFRVEGPFAILPCPNGPKGENRSGIVWSVPTSSTSPKNWSEDAFNMALQARFPARYGAVKRGGPIWEFPLTMNHAEKYTNEKNLALIADAAHGIHPLAGQGLNIGLRDVDALSRLLTGSDDIKIILAEYQRMRRPDNTGMVAAMDILNGLFATDFMPTALSRKIGLHAVNKLALAKEFFTRKAMGV
ncbi:MAG: FAD-binding protein [Alphaproteobacteria bacterium]|nr:FAD-binding protein [Alphaproteobacteria bacterium]